MNTQTAQTARYKVTYHGQLVSRHATMAQAEAAYYRLCSSNVADAMGFRIEQA